MADSIETLKELALLIRNATKTGENTAERVGRTLVGIIDYLNNEDITDFVTLDSEQEIIGLKHFAAGLSVGPGKHKLYEKDGVVYFEGDLAVTGGITQYATDGVSIPSIWEGIPFDNKTIWLNPETKKVEVIGGTGGDFDASAMWAVLAGSTNEQINKSHLTTALSEYATTESVSTLQSEITKKWTQDDAKIKNWDTAFGWGDHASAGYAHLAGEETFTGLKHFTKNITVGAGKKSIYEKDGVVYIDADVAVKGGLTQYATDGIGVSTIMDGVTADEVTITKGSDNVLRIKNAGSGSSFDKAAMWAALAAATNEQINKSHLNTALTGYATEDWVTEKNYAVKATTLAEYGITDAYTKTETDNKYLLKTSYTAADVLAKLKTVDGVDSGLDADLLDGTHKSGLFTALTSTSATNISITVGGTTKSITDLYANSAAKLETARTIWGQSFDGTKNISGALTSVTDITGTGTFTGANIKATSSVYVNGIRLYKSADNTLKIEGNLLVTGGITQYSTEESGGGSGGGGIDAELLWEILGGSGTQQINKSHLTDALKGYLTSVSLSTISDLHNSWDALLKAAPSGYVTRWPSISEVTNKQSLVVKLNSGTTEGTNMFTYNATAAKSINITPSAIGAAASSHNHSWSNITSGKPNSLSGYGITDAYTKTEADNKYLLKTSYTAADILAKLKTVDGTGSGLDADLLNGYRRLYSCSSGNKPYYRILTLTVTAGYVNNPVTFQISGRSSSETCFISIKFANASDKDPAIAAFYYFGDNRYGRYLRLYKTAASTWELWMKAQEEGYDGCDIYNLKPTSGISLVINSAGSDSLPTSSTYRDCAIGYVYASLKGNADTATKLQTPRTLWGRSFDGTQNVSGNLDGVGNITGGSSIDIISTNNGDIRLKRNNTTTSSVVLIANSFKPFEDANNQIDLGNSTSKWRDLHIGRTAYINQITSSFASGTWINSLKNAVINCNQSSFGAWINGKTKNGRIAIATYPSNGDLLYFGYAAQSKIDAGTDNSYTKQMTWNGATGELYTSGNIKAGADLYINGIRLHKSQDGVIKLEGSLAVTGGITQYAVDSVDIPTIMDGVVVDGTTIVKENGKLVVKNAGGGEAGSVAWGNITGKPSVFATNIGSISDLHSSWGAVLKAQKPNYLTAVSIATISDLNNSWDALLKAAPSSYVTRWPSISEVTGKQNLVIQFNGGTTEGTNKFTYNGTTAKLLVLH